MQPRLNRKSYVYLKRVFTRDLMRCCFSLLLERTQESVSSERIFNATLSIEERAAISCITTSSQGLRPSIIFSIPATCPFIRWSWFTNCVSIVSIIYPMGVYYHNSKKASSIVINIVFHVEPYESNLIHFLVKQKTPRTNSDVGTGGVASK